MEKLHWDALTMLFSCFFFFLPQRKSDEEMSKPDVGTNVGVEKNHDRTGNRRLAFETVDFNN